MSDRLGLPYFITLSAAVTYYRKQECDKVAVMQKVQAGEIFIGKPIDKAGYMTRLDREGRYFYESR